MTPASRNTAPSARRTGRARRDGVRLFGWTGVAAAALALVVAGGLPLAVMAGRVETADLARVLDARTLDLLGRTLTLGLGSALLALAIGLPYGFLVARTDVPGAGFLRLAGVVPLFLPPMLIAMTWTVLWDLRGAPMATLVLAANTFPLVAVFAARAAERIDGRAEDAARLAGGLRAVLAADARLLAAPAACGACLSFVFAVNDFSVPDYVAFVGPKFNVYAAEVFASWTQSQEPGRAVAAAAPLVALTVLALLPALALRRRGALASLPGDFRRPEPLRLGRARWPAFAFVALVLGATAGVPLARLAWEAGGGARGWSAEHLRAAVARALELARGDLRNSLLYALAAATACVPVALVLGHALDRARRGRLAEPLVLLPLAVPAILFGIGAIAVWNHAWSAAFYDGPGLVILLYAGRFAAFPVLLAAGAVASMERAPEEAALLAGAPPRARLARVVLPPLSTSFLAGWLLVFVLCMRELDAAILVPAANHTAMMRVFNAVHFGRDDFVAALALLLVAVILLPGALWALFARRRLEVLP